jgi:RNA polymerase sigma factor (sigma-70 family)
MAATEISTRANAALDDLYRHHVGEVYRYSYAVLGNHADAEDVTQTTFVNALRALERGDAPQNGSAWLIAIAQNVVRQRWRQAASRPAEVELVHDVPETPVEEDIEVDELVRALQRIPPAQREALVMRELEGRSYNEIAGLLGLTTSALETLLFRARRSLAEELENLVTCQNAELAMSKQLDGRLGRKERRRLEEHLAECPDCAQLAEMQKRQRRAFKGLAVLPIPVGLALFKGVPSASAAASLPTIGLAATGTTSNGAAGATGVGVGGATSGGAVAGGSLLAAAAKVAAVIVAATVAIGGAYKGVQLVRGDSPESTRASLAHETSAGSKPTTSRPAGVATAGSGTQTTRHAGAAAPAVGSQATTEVSGSVAMESGSPVVEQVAAGGPAADGAGATAANDAASAPPGAAQGTAPRTSAPPPATKPEPKQPPTAAPKPKPAPPAATPKPKTPGAGAPGTGGAKTPGGSPTSPGNANGGSSGAGGTTGNSGGTGSASGGGGQAAGAGQPSSGGQTGSGATSGTENGGASAPPPAPSTDGSGSGETAGGGCPGGGDGPGNGKGCGVGNAYGQDNGNAKP